MKAKKLSRLLLCVAAVTLVACNGGGGSGTGTTPVSGYTIYNMTGEEISKLVISDAGFKPIKTINSFNCSIAAACAISDKAGASFEFYDKEGKLLSATLIRPNATVFYAEDGHFGQYLLKFAVHDNQLHPSIESLQYERMQILGESYRDAKHSGLLSKTIKELLSKIIKEKAQTAANEPLPALTATSIQGNSACVFASKVLGPGGQLIGTLGKVATAMGKGSPFLEPFGALVSIGGGFTGAGCDVSSQVTGFLKQISAKLDVVISTQQKTLDAIAALDSSITKQNVYDDLNASDRDFLQLEQYNQVWLNLASPDDAIQKIGRPIESFGDYIQYKGGVDNALNDTQFNNFLANTIPAIRNQLQLVTKTDFSSSLSNLWQNADTLCKPNSTEDIVGGNMPALLSVCDYSATKVVQTYLPLVVQSEQLLSGVSSSLDEIKSSDPVGYDKLYSKLGYKLSASEISKIESQMTVPYTQLVSTHYSNTDNYYVTVKNGTKVPYWLQFVNQINQAGLLTDSSGSQPVSYNCVVSSMQSSAVQGQGTNATIDCYKLEIDRSTGNYGNYARNTLTGSGTVTNIQDTYGRFAYVLHPTMTDGTLWSNNPIAESAIPKGSWVKSCDVSTAKMIGPKDPLFGNYKMILKAQCDDGHGNKVWSYLDLRTRSNYELARGRTSSYYWYADNEAKRNPLNYQVSNKHGHLDADLYDNFGAYYYDSTDSASRQNDIATLLAYGNYIPGGIPSVPVTTGTNPATGEHSYLQDCSPEYLDDNQNAYVFPNDNSGRTYIVPARLYMVCKSTPNLPYDGGYYHDVFVLPRTVEYTMTFDSYNETVRNNAMCSTTTTSDLTKLAFFQCTSDSPLFDYNSQYWAYLSGELYDTWLNAVYFQSAASKDDGWNSYNPRLWDDWNHDYRSAFYNDLSQGSGYLSFWKKVEDKYSYQDNL